MAVTLPMPPPARPPAWDGPALARATGGRLVAGGPAGPPPGPLVTDSRAVGPGQWFLALRGARFDGHDFLRAARANGCAGAVAEAVPAGWDAGFVEVADTLEALQNLGRHVARGFDGPVVAITGSCGKTTARELTALALRPSRRVHRTEGNRNNHIGVPLTLAAMPAGAEACVLEMGMSAPGEIALLQEIAGPTVRVVTNVGPAHLAGCGGTLEGVARAKAELVAPARSGDVCVLNADDPRVAAMAPASGARVLTFGTDPGSDVWLRHAALRETAAGPKVVASLEDRVSSPGRAALDVEVPGVGGHLGICAAAAVAAAVAAGAPFDDAMAASLGEYEPVGMRMRLDALRGGARLFDDAYNANPLSVRNAVDTLAGLGGAGKRIVALGDMLELGPDEGKYHRDALEYALASGADAVLLTGPRFAAAAAAVGSARTAVAPTAAELARHVPVLRAGDAVLVKGSRPMAMEGLVRELKARRL